MLRRWTDGRQTTKKPATTGEAPAEFALIDEIAAPPVDPAVEHVVADASRFAC